MSYCYQRRAPPRAFFRATVSWSRRPSPPGGHLCTFHCSCGNGVGSNACSMPRKYTAASISVSVCLLIPNVITDWPLRSLNCFPAGELSSRIYHCLIISCTHINTHTLLKLVKRIYQFRGTACIVANSKCQFSRMHKTVMSNKTHKKRRNSLYRKTLFPVKTCFLCYYSVCQCAATPQRPGV